MTSVRSAWQPEKVWKVDNLADFQIFSSVGGFFNLYMVTKMQVTKSVGVMKMQVTKSVGVMKMQVTKSVGVMKMQVTKMQVTKMQVTKMQVTKMQVTKMQVTKNPPVVCGGGRCISHTDPHTHAHTHLVQCQLCEEEHGSSDAEAPLYDEILQI